MSDPAHPTGRRAATRWAAVAAALVAVALAAAGCAGFYVESVGVAYVDGGRPHPDYFCADCHGVAFFDPYYDLCLEYGYVFAWARHPQVRRVYRRDYVEIRRAYPRLGRFRYPRRYREEARERFTDERGRMPVYRNRGGRDDDRDEPRRGEKREGKRGEKRGKGKGTKARDRG